VSVDAPELRRVLGTRDLAVYYLSSLVGAGILVVPGIALEIAGPLSLVAWVLLSLAAFPIAATFARFSAEYPDSAGVGYLTGKAFGSRAGRCIGLFLLLLNLTTNPILGLAAARYLAALLGFSDRNTVLLAGLGVMLLAVLLNMLGVRVASQVQFALVVILVAGLVLVIASSLPAADAARLSPFAPNGWGALGPAIVVSFFSFFGWENVSHVADEVRDPRRSYPRAALLAAAVLGGLYTTLALVVAMVVPADAATDRNAVLAALLEFSRGPGAAQFGSGLAVALLVVTTNAWVYGASRLLYAMARDGVVPRRLSAVTERGGTPLAALAVLGVCYALDIGALLVLGGDESTLVAFVSASILIIYIAAFLAGFKLFTERGTRVLCGGALVAVTAFLLGGGLASVAGLVAFALTVGYVLLRGEPAEEPV
jgi:amino acid efflux transporter